MSELTVGIDLGTSNSCVALYAGRETEVIPNEFGDRTTPSVVAFAEDGKLLVGSPAWRQAIMNPRRTITAVKRLLGRRRDSDVVKVLEPVIPYQLAEAANGDAWVSVGGTEISPQEVQAYILGSLRDSTRRFLGHAISRAVITVPAFFDEVQRQGVRDSARIAGFESCRVLAEPTAAALAYGYGQQDNRTIAIVDLGGGTLDVTLMAVKGGRFEVLATDGDLLLGGHDFDNAIALAFAREIRAAHGVDVLSDAVAVQRLVAEAESAKRRLSQERSVSIELPFLAHAPGGAAIDFRRVLTREQLDELTREQLERIAAPCRAALAQAGLPAAACDEVILVGGMTRSPAIQRTIAALFGRQPSLRVNPDEVVAIGAALLAGAGGSMSFVDVLPRAIGIRVAGDRMLPLIAKSSPMPASATKGFATTTDSQRVFELRVLQGEDPVASRNRELANVVIDGLPPRKAGEVKLRLTLSVDSEGGLNVRATELATHTDTHAEIRPSAGLVRAQVERLAAEHAQRRGESPTRAAAASAPAPGPARSSTGFSVDFAPSATPPPKTSRATAVPAPALQGVTAPRPSAAPSPSPHPVAPSPAAAREVTPRPAAAGSAGRSGAAGTTLATAGRSGAAGTTLATARGSRARLLIAAAALVAVAVALASWLVLR